MKRSDHAARWLPPVLLLLATAAITRYAIAREVQVTRIADIGTLGGSVWPSGINAAGQVVGWANLPNSADYHAFLYSAGVIADLGALGGSRSYATGINAKGQVTGVADLPGDANYHAFLYSANRMMDLGGSYSAAAGINAGGQIAESSMPALGARAGFLSSGAASTPLGTLGGSITEPSAINDQGQVVGKSGIAAADDIYHAFLYSGGSMRDLGTLGGSSSAALGINNVGQVVGYSLTLAGMRHAFLYTGGQMKDLGTLGGTSSEANSVNDSGQIVGYASTKDGATHAFLYSDGVMTDLNTLLGGWPCWHLENASAINESGQIAVQARKGTGTRCFLMSVQSTRGPGRRATGLFGVILLLAAGVWKKWPPSPSVPGGRPYP